MTPVAAFPFARAEILHERLALRNMTLIKPFGDDGATDECLAVAEELLQEAGLALAEFTRKIRRREPVTGRDAKPVIGELAAATRLVMTERNRVADERRKDRGVVHDFAIDFEAARAEIGSRLARLREAGDD